MNADAQDNSTRLREVIKSLRACKTTAEERNVVFEESAKIRAAFRIENSANRHRNVAKLIFFHLLGYNTSFGHIECLKLIIAKKYGEKKIGYLALTQIMGEEDELTLMAISSIQADLASDRPSVVAMALCAVANTASSDMSRELANSVLSLLSSTSPSIKAKAALAACRILHKCPDLVDDFTPLATTFVDEHQPPLLGAGMSLILTIMKADPSKIEHFATFSAAYQTSIKDLVMRDPNYELDIHNVTDPFTQCRLLEVLRFIHKERRLDPGDFEETLSYVLTSTEFVRQTGRCVIYECCKTILETECSSSLREQAISMLGKLLTSKENNTRYIALKGLTKDVVLSGSAGNSLRESVLDCMKDPDRSVAVMALELMVQMVNQSNVAQMTRDMLNLLVTVETEMKEAIAMKICMVAELFSQDQRSYLDTMVRVLSLAGAYIGDDTIYRTANIILSCQALHEDAVKMLYFAAKDNLVQEGLVLLALWCIGEYGDLLISGSEVAHLPLPTSSEVVQFLKSVLDREISLTCKQYALTTLAKTAVRLPSEAAACKYALEEASLNPVLELQQRACEYLVILQDQWSDLRPRLFETMPVFEKEGKAAVVVTPLQSAISQVPKVVDFPVVSWDEFTVEPVIELATEPAKPGQTWAMDLLGIDNPQNDTGRPVDSGANPNVLDLGGILFAPADSTPEVSLPKLPSLDLVVYTDSNLRVVFSCKKEDWSHLEATLIIVTASSVGEATLKSFKFAPSTQKHVVLQVLSCSGTKISAGSPVTIIVRVVNKEQERKRLSFTLDIEYQKEEEWTKTRTVLTDFKDPF